MSSSTINWPNSPAGTQKILANELQLLSELDLDFDIEVTGFEMGEIDVLIESQGGEHDPADDVPDVDNARSPVTLLGDVWLLGPHRLACGNALSSESYTILIGFPTRGVART